VTGPDRGVEGSCETGLDGGAGGSCVTGSDGGVGGSCETGSDEGVGGSCETGLDGGAGGAWDGSSTRIILPSGFGSKRKNWKAYTYMICHVSVLVFE